VNLQTWYTPGGSSRGCSRGLRPGSGRVKPSASVRSKGGRFCVAEKLLLPDAFHPCGWKRQVLVPFLPLVCCLESPSVIFAKLTFGRPPGGWGRVRDEWGGRKKEAAHDWRPVCRWGVRHGGPFVAGDGGRARVWAM